MATLGEINTLEALSRLTAKQREVLDLLLDHKTSKEIAQILKISPHTVDQRIQFAKRQLVATSRSDVARIYRDHKAVYERSIYEDSRMSRTSDISHQVPQDDVQTSEPNRFQSEPTWVKKIDNRIVPELFVGANGRGFRLIAILMIALLTILLALGGLAIYSFLAEILAR